MRGSSKNPPIFDLRRRKMEEPSIFDLRRRKKEEPTPHLRSSRSQEQGTPMYGFYYHFINLRFRHLQAIVTVCLTHVVVCLFQVKL